MPLPGYRSRPIKGRGAFVLRKVPAGTLGDEEPESTWEWLPVAQVTDAMDIRLATNESEVSSPWDEWDRYTLGRKKVEALLIPVLYNASLMGHSFAHPNGAGRAFLDRSFPIWRIWTQAKTDEGSMCMEFRAAITRIGLHIPHQDLQKGIFGFRVSGPVRWPIHNELAAIIGARGKDLVAGG